MDDATPKQELCRKTVSQIKKFYIATSNKYFKKKLTL
jgi:hypothetical protein